MLKEINKNKKKFGGYNVLRQDIGLTRENIVKVVNGIVK